MNFLAHMLLSCEEEELLVGNFLGDFIKNRELPSFSPGIQRGVRLHRHIDSFTDAHPLVRQGTKRLHATHGKYAGVVVDVLYDYVLANHWEEFGPRDLQSFADKTYETLSSHTHLMPERLHGVVPRMIADNWLVRYGTREGIAFTFSRLQRRVSKPEFLEGVLPSLDQNEKELTEEFRQFFPEIAEAVQVFCAC